MAVPTVYGRIIEAAKDGKNKEIIEKVIKINREENTL